MRVGRVVLGLLGVVVLGAAGLLILAWRPAIDPIEPPPRASFDRALVAEGTRLAAIGNCGSCHTRIGGPAYAGGRALHTLFGTIYTLNITPDPETGIGRWSEAAFRRAMREGVDRAGRHLYPAFPYDHFAKVTDEDLHAIYAFLMSRDPVRETAPPDELPFPLNLRPLLAGWKLLFLGEDPFRPDPSRGSAWSRGAYFAEGLAHCGACHTPRNALGAEEDGGEHQLEGGEVEGWHAPALKAASPAPVRWDAESLFTYLRYGFDARHGMAAGPMALVVCDLARVPEADVRAIATYIASMAGPVPLALAEWRTAGVVPAAEGERGAAIFARACASCHDASGGPPSTRLVALTLSSAVAGPDPRNLINIVLDGIRRPEGVAGQIMPGLADALTDGQVADLVTYLRERFSDRRAWTGVDEAVRDARQEKETGSWTCLSGVEG
jgi:mono/diheme cytochrome c family protein